MMIRLQSRIETNKSNVTKEKRKNHKGKRKKKKDRKRWKFI
jgi:hypothetical protein